MNVRWYLIVGGSSLLCFPSMCGERNNPVPSFSLATDLVAVEQRDASAGNDMQLDMGRVTFLFNRMPMVEVLDSESIKNADKQSVTLFLPFTKINAHETQQIVKSLANKNYAWGKISVTMVNRPVAGIKIFFQYDPRVAQVVWDRIEDHTMRAGVVIRVFNKQLLDRLAAYESKMLCVA